MKNSSGPAITQLVQLFERALLGLNARFDGPSIEGRAFLVYQVMSGRSREFHQVGHVLEVAEGLGPRETLGAIYHDLVYFQVDHGIASLLWPRLRDLIEVSSDSLHCRQLPAGSVEDSIARVFGIRPGDPLESRSCLNELLSAWVMANELRGLVADDELVAIAACIEATIPFRSPDAAGRTASAILEAALRSLNAKRAWGWSDAHVAGILRSAVTLANADVRNFACQDAGEFLDHTWKLLPEHDASLQNVGTYSIRKYRSALERMESTLGALPPERVFREHAGYPEAAETERLRKRAARNLSVAVLYLRGKLVSVALLEGLAELSGGSDAPISYFAGAADGQGRQLHELLPDPHECVAASWDGIDQAVFRVLNFGRTTAGAFDTKTSPLSAYFFGVFGKHALCAHFDRAKLAFAGKLGWTEFLDGFPPELVSALAEGAAEFAASRRDRLRALAAARR